MFRIQTSAGVYGGYNVAEVTQYLVSLFVGYDLNCGYDVVKIAPENAVKVGDMLIRNRVIDVDVDARKDASPSVRIFNDNEWVA